MLNRCYWEKSDMFKHYGARGIEVCDDWKNKENGFECFSKWAFDNGYKEGLTLDRIDCNKGYCPENCRWVDAYVQANNKRKRTDAKSVLFLSSAIGGFHRAAISSTIVDFICQRQISFATRISFVW